MKLLKKEKNGIIINSIDDCVNAITKLNNDFSFTPKEVNQVVTKKFNSEKIINQYETLFLNLTEN